MCESEIFVLARKLSPAEREQFLSDACGSNAELRAGVEELLAEDDDGTIVKANMEHARELAALPPGSLFADRYRLLEKIGEGGMGTVYLADQLEPVQRRVAIKVLHSIFVSKSTFARFEQERQALAVMDHPNIAKVFDAGVCEIKPDALSTESASHEKPTGFSYPYLVMELIEGISITDYCSQHNLTLKQRVELMLLVCHAIQHAHQKGIIHRDLKPGNILVGMCDGIAVPKIIDFGVAKATDVKLTERIVSTEIGSIIGTLEYMSPEQAQLDGLDVDTRTDIYALGVILYELLTGTVPVHRRELQQAGLLEMLRIIKEVPPLKPSSRVSRSGITKNVAMPVSSHSGIFTVPSDLDCIVMKALEKDRELRYSTASVLALDLQHYLDNDPILARPASAGYRLKKFAQKHWGSLVATAALFITMASAIVATSWGLVEAKWQRSQAEFHEQEALSSLRKERAAKEAANEAHSLASRRLLEAKNQHKQALDQQKITQAVTDFFLEEMVRQTVKGTTAPGKDMTVKEALDRAAGTVQGKFDSKTEAAIRQALAQAYQELGEPEKGSKQQNTATALNKGGPASATANTGRLTIAMSSLFRGSNLRTIPNLETRLADQQKKFGVDGVQTIPALRNLAVLYQEKGQLERAIELFRKTVELNTRQHGVNSQQAMASTVELAKALGQHGAFRDAIQVIEPMFKPYQERWGREHALTVSLTSYLAGMYSLTGDYPKALPLYVRTLLHHLNTGGAHHPQTHTAVKDVALCYLIIAQPEIFASLGRRVQRVWPEGVRK